MTAQEHANHLLAVWQQNRDKPLKERDRALEDYLAQVNAKRATK